ncbi:MAG: hypothetical protein LBS61_04095 [Endomicrobium sp.]|jgi:hypothetical protein|nr:hypothetical protein [Endomicrobium sp.]
MKKYGNKVLKITLLAMTLSLFVFVAEGQAQLKGIQLHGRNGGSIFRSLTHGLFGSHPPLTSSVPTTPFEGMPITSLDGTSLGGGRFASLMMNPQPSQGIVPPGAIIVEAPREDLVEASPLGLDFLGSDFQKRQPQVREANNAQAARLEARNSRELVRVNQAKEEEVEQLRSQVVRLQQELVQLREANSVQQVARLEVQNSRELVQVNQAKEEVEVARLRLQQQVQEEREARESQVARINRFNMLGCKLATMLGISKVANIQLRKQINEMELQNDDMQSRISKVVRLTCEEVSRLEKIIAEKDAQISQIRGEVR